MWDFLCKIQKTFILQIVRLHKPYGINIANFHLNIGYHIPKEATTMPIKLEERPIIMIGAERSGTTLVMAMVGCHRRIAVPEVVWYYSRFRPYLHTFGDLSKEENFRTLASEMVFGLKSPFWDMKVNVRSIVDEIVDSVRERSFAGLYCAMFEYYARYMGNKPRWGEKTPYNLFFIKEILEDFPNTQFIYIVRDGRDASVDYIGLMKI
jgi:hypothetical protein